MCARPLVITSLAKEAHRGRHLGLETASSSHRLQSLYLSAYAGGAALPNTTYSSRTAAPTTVSQSISTLQAPGPTFAGVALALL